LVSSHNGILIKTKLTLCLNTIVVIRLRRQGSSINVPTLRRNALDPAPDPHTTGVSRKRIDNSDAAIHGLPDISNNVGSVKQFVSRLVLSLQGSGLVVLRFSFRGDGHGSPVI
jgi:hypothetical protein